MPKIKRILFPVDFSAAACGAAKYVAATAGRFQAAVTMLHVVGMGEHSLAEELLPLRRAELNTFAADELRHLDVHRLCITGDDPAAAITAEAARWAADLVMMPTHGLGIFRRFLLGSVTGKILHDLDCPIWTTVHSEQVPKLEEIHCRKILCALDLDNRTDQILAWASWLADQLQASLGIAHATTDPRALFPLSLQEEFAKDLNEQAERKIQELLARLGMQSAVSARDIRVRSGDPAEVLTSAAAEFEADLIVIGRHNRSGLRGRLQQNAYTILCSSPCPVISI
ncbi:MAG TPA: universal stress protein [Bryobacteraceae bacterium]|nr:universal stress protein [Bryobacteraceae bacterium]